MAFVCICFADMHLFHCCFAFVCYWLFCFNVFKQQSMARKWFPIILSICLHYLVESHWKFTERDSLRGIYMATYQNLRRPFKPLYCDLQENKNTCRCSKKICIYLRYGEKHETINQSLNLTCRVILCRRNRNGKHTCLSTLGYNTNHSNILEELFVSSYCYVPRENVLQFGKKKKLWSISL